MHTRFLPLQIVFVGEYAEQKMNAFEMVNKLGLATGKMLDYREGSDLVSVEKKG